MSRSKLFPDAAVLGGAPRLQELLHAGADVSERDQKGRTALFRVCRAGQADKARLLLIAGSDPNATNECGEAPLQAAARYGHIECVRVLLEGGAAINYCPPSAITDYSESALSSAARKCPAAARLLLANGADPNVATDAKIYPLFAAINWGHSDLVPVLLECGASVAVCDSDGSSPLHAALASGSASAVKVLVAAGVDPNARDGRGNTPIFRALNSSENTLDAIRELLLVAPDLSLYGSLGMTPLELAIQEKKTEIVELLQNAGSPAPRETTKGDLVVFADDESDTDGLGEWESIPSDNNLSSDDGFLEATPQDQELALEVDLEISSIFKAIGHEFSDPHWQLLKSADRPMSLRRLAYFPRGFMNAELGRELEDGPAVMDEPYEAAAARFVALGYWRETLGPRAMQIVFSLLELKALAASNNLKSSGTKSELVDRLFPLVDPLALRSRLSGEGGYFELTSSGIEEVGKFQGRRRDCEVYYRRRVLDALTKLDFGRAVRDARILTLLKNTKPHWVALNTKPLNITVARLIRCGKLPSDLCFDAALENEYLAVLSADMLFNEYQDDWSSWNVRVDPPHKKSGEAVTLTALSHELRRSIYGNLETRLAEHAIWSKAKPQ